VARPVPDQLLLRPRRRNTVEVFALAEEAPDTAGLQTPRPGLWLGTLRKSRFEPSYALALTLTPDEVHNRLDEPVGSPQIARYLQGEPLQAPGAPGWVLICVAGFPLGWGKRSGDTIKNHYPKALRWI
jgi:NOL1/NOP2/fmu family ribosome biogenesis protein